MCGIAGIIKKEARDYEGAITKMISSLNHRGPDETGFYYFDSCAFGHARLSIIDIQSGQQPMLSDNKKLGVVFNGEIYGYKKIKEELGEYIFENDSDTEVILALYEKYGREMLAKLPGMFAFALWDNDGQELFCARDRFGEKPFYYAIGQNGEFIFASEIKAILATGLIEPTLDRDSLAFYLKHLYVNPYKTIYSNVHVLPPAHSLSWKDGKISIIRYWNFPSVDKNIGLAEATEKFRTLFTSAVESQLVADVPVGAFLSGGLDSSTVVAVASQFKSKLKTFSFSFENSINELPYARQIANKYETDHVELSDNDYDVAGLLLAMSDVFDEPFADSSNIPTFLISKLARKHVKVVLTGDGGDELLGGYSGWYKPLLYALEDKNELGPWASAVMPYAINIAHKFRLPFRERLSSSYAGSLIRKQGGSVIEKHQRQNSYFTDDEISSLLLAKGTAEAYQSHWKVAGSLDDVMFMDVDNYMSGDILTKIDRAAMANSLELRAPFLERDFATFCLSLPHTLKINKKSDKIVMRQAFSSSWTPSINRRGKQGFGAPVSRWLKLPKVVKLKQEYLLNANQDIYKIISFEQAQQFFAKDNYQTWTLLVLAIWLKGKKI